MSNAWPITGQKLTEKEIDEMMQDADFDRDGKISYQGKLISREKKLIGREKKFNSWYAMIQFLTWI